MFPVMSVLHFNEKNAFVTKYLLESFLARFKDVVCCFQAILFVYFLPYEREQEVQKCFPPKHFRVSGIKISNVVTKETS